jgi:hypothetical protein
MLGLLCMCDSEAGIRFLFTQQSIKKELVKRIAIDYILPTLMPNFWRVLKIPVS